MKALRGRERKGIDKEEAAIVGRRTEGIPCGFLKT